MRVYNINNEIKASVSIMKNKRLVRISDIAREANVSLATVDRVLHKRGNVSEATQRIVHAAMEKLASGAPTSRHLRTKRLRV
jgi:DNA-binding LacI/PurR family transcriptional regulator